MSSKIAVLSIISFLFLSCGGPSQKSNCPLGKPTPIFNQDLAKVKSHAFTANGQKGLENVVFSDESHLELIQDGCDKISQEFRFKTDKFNSEWSANQWFEAGIERIRFMANVSEQHAIFNQWADALNAQQNSWKLSGPLELGPGFSAKVDRIISGQEAYIIIVFFQS